MSTSGKFLTASADGLNIDGTHEWELDEDGQRLEATTGLDNGRGRKDCGVIDTKISVKWYLDIATGAFARMRAGTILTDVALFADVNSTALYFIIEAEVYNFRIVGQVRGQMICTSELEPKGDVIVANDP